MHPIEVPEPKSAIRQYAMGLGRGEASPGEEVSLMVETTNDFKMDKLVLGKDLQCFVVLRVSVDDVDVSIIQGVNASLGGSEGFPLRAEIKTGQKIKVVLRNESDVRAKIVGAVFGTVNDEESKMVVNRIDMPGTA
jgi:hypothetical protein